MIKLLSRRNVLVLNHVKNIELLYSKSKCVIFPATKMTNKIDIPHSIIEPLFLKVHVLINNIQPLNELKKDLLFNFFSNENLITAIEDTFTNNDLIGENFAYANLYYRNNNLSEYQKLY